MVENPAAFHLNSLNYLPIASKLCLLLKMLFAKAWLVRVKRERDAIGGGNDRVGWKCSSKFEVIHVCLFDIEVRASPPLFIQTVRRRAGAGERLVSLVYCFWGVKLPCLLYFTNYYHSW